MSRIMPEQQIEWAAEYLATADFDRYIDACDTFGITPAKWSVWWARYGDDYRAQIKIAALSPVTEQLVEEVAGSAAGGLLGSFAVGGVAPASDTSPALSSDPPLIGAAAEDFAAYVADGGTQMWGEWWAMFHAGYLLAPSSATGVNPTDLGRFECQADGIAAAVASGLTVWESPHFWAAPGTKFGPAEYELRQLSPGIFEWVLS